jgi:hypothetical protein
MRSCDIADLILDGTDVGARGARLSWFSDLSWRLSARLTHVANVHGTIVEMVAMTAPGHRFTGQAKATEEPSPGPHSTVDNRLALEGVGELDGLEWAPE